MGSAERLGEVDGGQQFDEVIAPQAGGQLDTAVEASTGPQGASSEARPSWNPPQEYLEHIGATATQARHHHEHHVHGRHQAH